MDKFIDINLTEALRAILETNTVDFKTDFNYDVEIINRAAQSNDPQEKTLLWLSRNAGTDCDTEQQTFIQKTDGHINWCSFEGSTIERILAYAIEVKGINENGVVTGDLFELNYHTHAGHVRADSVPLNEDIKKIYFKDGYVNQVSMEDAAHIYIYSGEDISHSRYEPENPAELEMLLRQEKENRERLYVISDFGEHIRRLKDGRITFEAERIAAELGKALEPNSPEKTGFMAQVSPYFARTASTRDFSMLAKAIPFKSVQLCTFKGRDGLYALIDNKEMKQNRKSSILGQIADGKKAVSQAADTQKHSPKRSNDKEV